MDRTNAFSDNSLEVSIPDSNRGVFSVEKAIEVSREKWLGKNLPIMLGEACDELQFVDLQMAPHILVAGGAKSERDAFLKQAMRSLCAVKEPDEVDFYLFGGQMSECQLFANHSVYCDTESISAGLSKLVTTMEYRYEKLIEKGCRPSFDVLRSSMPFIVALIDGIDKDIENNVLKLCSKGRAVGIHLILSVQSTSNKVITGFLKACFPTRIAFHTETAAESMLILDCKGAEFLAGGGDMLFECDMDVQRIQMRRDK